jgi:hypothetical protein
MNFLNPKFPTCKKFVLLSRASKNIYTYRCRTSPEFVWIMNGGSLILTFMCSGGIACQQDVCLICYGYIFSCLRITFLTCVIQLMDVNESPVYLLLNPAINLSQKDLPVTIYESGKLI